jgi:predicted nucleic acid-binding protein
VRVIVDTSVWSLFVRRRPRDLSPEQRRIVLEMRRLIPEGRAVLVGAVRQELLSGIADDAAFERVREYATFFDDEPPDVEDYELAARFHNRCRRAGVATSTTDMLLCAISDRRSLPVLTTDADFTAYGTIVPLRLYLPPDANL